MHGGCPSEGRSARGNQGAARIGANVGAAVGTTGAGLPGNALFREQNDGAGSVVWKHAHVIVARGRVLARLLAAARHVRRTVFLQMASSVLGDYEGSIWGHPGIDSVVIAIDPGIKLIAIDPGIDSVACRSRLIPGLSQSPLIPGSS